MGGSVGGCMWGVVRVEEGKRLPKEADAPVL
jgi:hypothetical protein